MKLKSMFLEYLVAIGFATFAVHAQEISTSSRVMYQLTQIVCKDGNAKMGAFIGLKGDSLLLHVSAKTERIPRKDVLTVSVEKQRERGAAALSGTLLGLYAGNLFFLKAEDQPFSFTRSYEGWFVPLLYDALFAFVGGGIGYLVGAAESGTEIFDFAGSGEASEKEWERLRRFVAGVDDKTTVHVSLQCSWVSNSAPSQANSLYAYFPYSEVTNLNMMRKMQITLTLSPLVDCGIAVMWLGQPSFTWSVPSYYYAFATVELDGRGYYAVGVFKPLASLGLRNVQWDVGVGIGLASMSYKVTEPVGYHLPTDSLRLPNVETKKSMFSGLIYTELKVFLSDYYSLGLVGGYTYIPGELPAVPKIGLDARKMGSSSFGLVLGLHF